jgi:hypothetical protein
VTPTWTAAAEAFAEQIREPGFKAAGINASSWKARVDPVAMRNTVQAAAVLTDGDALADLWQAADPVPGAAPLLAWCEELEGEIAGLLGCGQKMAAACINTGQEAERDYAVARAKALAAQRMLSAANETDRNAAAIDLAAAEEEMAAAAQAMADCEAAMEILQAALHKLSEALKAIRQVPQDLGEVYEAVGDLIRDRGIQAVPYSGDFLAPNAA